MVARLWTALLMLTAVFAMHGLQCTSAADGAGSAATTAHVATTAHAGPVAMTALTAGQARTAPGAASFDNSMPAHPATAAAVAAPVDAGHGGGPHDWAAHRWTACLAVLAVALAVLLSLLVPRLVQLGPPAPRSANTRAGRWVTPPRPPDLSALCLLRI